MNGDGEALPDYHLYVLSAHNTYTTPPVITSTSIIPPPPSHLPVGLRTGLDN